MKKIKKSKGITLVVLVVTVVVLMILAGITISMASGQDGVINKSKEEKERSLNDEIATQLQINALYDNLNKETELSSNEGNNTNTTPIQSIIPSTIAQAKGEGVLSTTSNISLKDDNNNTIILPAGFEIPNDSATKQDNGVVIEDKDANQFVWIPVPSISSYVRTNFGKQGGSYTDYLETIPSDEQTSVTNNHGYYIGRYETGDSISTAGKTFRTSGTGITNKLAIKRGQVPYNYVTRDQAKTLSEGMDTAEGYKAITKLCSSYAWDTTLNFIQKTTTNYSTSSNQGNYTDTTFNYIDITGTNQTKPLNTSLIVPTGQTTPVCNIYDMGGNEWEWTSEARNNATYSCVYRGGSNGFSYANYPSGCRYYDTTSYYNVGVTFRITLYL